MFRAPPLLLAPAEVPASGSDRRTPSAPVVVDAPAETPASAPVVSLASGENCAYVTAKLFLSDAQLVSCAFGVSVYRGRDPGDVHGQSSVCTSAPAANDAVSPEPTALDAVNAAQNSRFPADAASNTPKCVTVPHGAVAAGNVIAFAF